MPAVEFRRLELGLQFFKRNYVWNAESRSKKVRARADQRKTGKSQKLKMISGSGTCHGNLKMYVRKSH